MRHMAVLMCPSCNHIINKEKFDDLCTHIEDHKGAHPTCETCSYALEYSDEEIVCDNKSLLNPKDPANFRRILQYKSYYCSAHPDAPKEK